MRKFEEILHLKTYTNQYGETMQLVMDENYDLWFYHDDCNKDFEDINILSDYPMGFKYVLTENEKNILMDFIDDSLEAMEDIWFIESIENN
jgi:hypothetical protein